MIAPHSAPALHERLLSDFDPILSTFPLPELNGLRIFVTGGTGFVGYWLLLAFRWLNQHGAGIHVSVLSRDPERFLIAHPEYRPCPWLHWIKGDVKHYDLPPQPFDAFIHGAADTSPAASRSTALFEDIVQGTRHVLDHAARCEVRRILLISSGAVYGVPSDTCTPIGENSHVLLPPLAEDDFYGLAKRLMEQAGQEWSRNHRAHLTIARCFSFSGFGLPEHLAASHFIHDALYNSEIHVAGDGRAFRSLLYASDMAVWLLTLLARGQNGRVYNVGSIDGLSILQIATIVRNQNAPGKLIKVIGSDVMPPRPYYVPDVSRIIEELGVSIWTTTAQGLAKMAASTLLSASRARN